MLTKISYNILLTGFMGAGKSTVGKLLAGLLGCSFADLDELIAKCENRTIPDIFAADGENYFRDCETDILNKLPQQPVAVYATGGGLVMREENRRIMKKLGKVVYLKADWSTLEKRLQHGSGRPLVDSGRGWHEVKDLWDRRQPFYEEADLVLLTDELTPLQVAQKISLELSS
jgi:shikimate kinase